MVEYIKINPKDNVAVALCDLTEGSTCLGVTLLQNISKGHKFALENIKQRQNVIKYGAPIGSAKQDISVGEHVHTHNMATNLSGQLTYCYSPVESKAIEHCQNRTIQVYPRYDGNVGIRNELWVIPLVGCVNSQARAIVKRFEKLHPVLQNVDGVHAFTHPYGCSQMGADHVRTRTLLQQMATHPNCGGVLLLGLGCENNRLDEFIQTLGNYDKNRVRFLIAQDVEDEIASGIELLEELYQYVQMDKREPRDMSCLRVGLKCGGSDGLSGITANPLVGMFSDYIVSCGGTTVLTEVPEMFGAEQLLMDRCIDEQTFNKTVKLINNFKQYYQDNNQPCYENPSPGNKAGGITTLEDKSLGCTQKSGSSVVCGVALDGEKIEHSGLNLLNGPGNDMVAVTNLGCAGCHLVLFTTGRGTPFGGFVPTVKISTNSQLANHKSNWIDFDAGSIVAGDSFESKLEQFVEYIQQVASGKPTKNELTDSREIALFKTGVTL